MKLGDILKKRVAEREAASAAATVEELDKIRPDEEIEDLTPQETPEADEEAGPSDEELKATEADSAKPKGPARVGSDNQPVLTLPMELVHPWQNQPREYFNQAELNALGQSIREVGQKIPIVIKRDPTQPGTYGICDGERRWRACKLINRGHIQAIVRPGEIGDEDSDDFSFVANFNRAGHTIAETIRGLRHQHTVRKRGTGEIAAMLGKSKGWVTQHLSLTKLDPKVIAMMHKGRPSEKRLKLATALLLTSLPARLQIDIATKITAQKTGIRAAAQIVNTMAAKEGFRIGGVSGEPNRKRRSLAIMFTAIREKLPTFLESPTIPLTELLASFSEFELGELAKSSSETAQGLSAIHQAIEAAQIATRQKREVANRPNRPKLKQKMAARPLQQVGV